MIPYLTLALPCETISSLTHGNITCSGYVTDQSCSYQCSSGFNLIGPDQRKCLPSAQWSGDDPACKRMYFLFSYLNLSL